MTTLKPTVLASNGEPVVVASKTRAPRVREGCLERPRLLQVLRGTGDTGIVVVRAPAGCGKTTLLAQWTEVDRSRYFGWVTLDESDDDPGQLWRLIVGALDAAAPEVTVQAREAIARPSPDIHGAVIPALLNDLAVLERPLVLVLDNWQVVNDPACNKSMSASSLSWRLQSRSCSGPERNQPST